MTDLPQHAAQVSLLFNLEKPTFPFSDFFERNLFTPYLFGYSLIAALYPIFGVVAASKMVISLALALFPIAVGYFLCAVGSNSRATWLVFPTLYGFSYQWGLLNFIVAAPLGIFLLGLTLKQTSGPTLKSSLLAAFALNILFFCHALICGFFVIIMTAYWLYQHRGIKNFAVHAWPLLSILPGVIIWIIYNYNHASVVFTKTLWDLSWFDTNDAYYSLIASWRDAADPGWGRIIGIIPRLLGVRPDFPYLVIGCSVFILPFFSGYRFTLAPVRLIPLAVCIGTLLFAPSFIFGTAFVYQRFTLFLLPLFFATLDFPRERHTIHKWIWLSFPAIAFAWIISMCTKALLIDTQQEGFSTILTQMEPGKKTLSMIFARDDPVSIAPTFLHFPAWYAATKQGVTDPSAAGFVQMPVVFLPSKIPVASVMGFEWDPYSFNWQKYNGDQYDYFVVRAEQDLSSRIFGDAPAGVSLLSHAGSWYLYGCKHFER